MNRSMLLIVSFSCLLLSNERVPESMPFNNVDSTDIETSKKTADLPLHNKNYGIEINPIFLIISEKNNVDLSGAISFFNISRKLELAIPFEYIDRKDDKFNDIDNEYRRFTADLQLRKFLKGIQNGLYFSGGLRYTNEYGIDDDLWMDIDIAKYYSINKVGLSFGIGYRYFSTSGLYWGISLYGGRYFTGTDIVIDNLAGASLNSDIFFDMEILKFGYAF